MRKIIILTSLMLLTSLVLVNVIGAQDSGDQNGGSYDYIYVDISNVDPPFLGTQEHPYHYIQDGINNADVGDTVYVYDYLSPYIENIVISKNIKLLGENKETTIIDGEEAGDVIEIYASHVTIEGLTIRNSGKTGFDHGISVKEQSPAIADIHIKDCIITDNGGGVRFNEATDSSIENCYIHDNKYSPITIYLDSSDILIKDCIIANHGDGVFSGGISIDGISAAGCICSNIEITGCEIYGSTSSAISIANAEDIEIYDNHIYDNGDSGIFINGVSYSANGIYIYDNVIENNDEEQITLQDCRKAIVTIQNNIISSYDKDGILLCRSSYNEIIDNTIKGNSRGIYFEGTKDGNFFTSCKNNNIIGNEIKDNYYGVYSNFLSLNNKFYHNDFKDNNKNAYDFGTNKWYDSTIDEGNYWDDYSGVDEDGDGVGETSYNIPPYIIRNRDIYPLVSSDNPDDPEQVINNADVEQSDSGVTTIPINFVLLLENIQSTASQSSTQTSSITRLSEQSVAYEKSDDFVSEPVSSDSNGHEEDGSNMVSSELSSGSENDGSITQENIEGSGSNESSTGSSEQSSSSTESPSSDSSSQEDNSLSSGSSSESSSDSSGVESSGDSASDSGLRSAH